MEVPVLTLILPIIVKYLDHGVSEQNPNFGGNEAHGRTTERF